MKLARMVRLFVETTDGLSQKQVAAEIGINESTLSRFLNGESMPDAVGFSKILTWCLSESIAPPSESLASRVEALERAINSNAPAIEAAWKHVRLGGHHE